MQRSLKTVVLPEHRANLAEWPPGVEVPSELRAKVFYDFENKALDSGGALTSGEERTLLTMAPPGAVGNPLRSAVQQLLDLPSSFTPWPNEVFITEEDIQELFGPTLTGTQSMPATDGFTVALHRLLPYLVDSLSDQVVPDELGGRVDC